MKRLLQRLLELEWIRSRAEESEQVRALVELGNHFAGVLPRETHLVDRFKETQRRAARSRRFDPQP